MELERDRLIEQASAEASTPASTPSVEGERVEGDVSINELVEVVRDAGEIDALRLTQLLPLSYDGARLRLARYAKRGLLVRVSKGKYRVSQLRLPTNRATHISRGGRVTSLEESELPGNQFDHITDPARGDRVPRR
jgi:hypothetical protein